MDAFNRGDLDAMLELAGRGHFEYDWSRSRGPKPRRLPRPEGFLEFVNEQWSMFDELRVEPTN